MRQVFSFLNTAILILITASAGSFMAYAAYTDSAIFDETAHIVAGYNYLKNLDYRFNPEHPPLVKMAAAIPLLFENLNFSKDAGYWEGLNEQWWAGNTFLYESRNDADKIIFSARIGPIIIALLLLLLTFYWAQKLMSKWWALLPTALLAFSPIFLAHGHYVTTDVGATFGILLSIFCFLNFLNSPTKKNLVFAGLAFGVAQAIKFSAILLISYIFFIGFVFAVVKSAESGVFYYKKAFYNILNQIKNSFFIMAIGYIAVVYPLYFLSTYNYPIEKQAIDTTLLVSGFQIDFLADLNIWMTQNKILKPFAEYMLGVLMVLRRTAGGNNAFFMGELSSHGWWYYFPLIYLLKESAATLFILLIAGIVSLIGMIKSMADSSGKIFSKILEYFSTHFTEFSMIAFIALYWASSMSNPLNIGVRHILPTIPLFYILAASSFKKWFSLKPIPLPISFSEKFSNTMRRIFNFGTKTFILSSLIIWLIAGTALASPYFLSNFNDFAGGKFNGYEYATDSNFDWGQDLKRLKIWVDLNLEPTEKIAVDYFGGGNPKYYLGSQYEPWWSSRGNPKDENIQWLAVSVNTLQGAFANLAPDFYRNPADEYRWLENYKNPADKAGTAIFIYRLK